MIMIIVLNWNIMNNKIFISPTLFDSVWNTLNIEGGVFLSTRCFVVGTEEK